MGKNETLNSNLDCQESCTWIGVSCFGKRVTGEFARLYEKTYKGITFYLQNGFTSSRGVKVQMEKLY